MTVFLKMVTQWPVCPWLCRYDDRVWVAYVRFLVTTIVSLYYITSGNT